MSGQVHERSPPAQGDPCHPAHTPQSDACGSGKRGDLSQPRTSMAKQPPVASTLRKPSPRPPTPLSHSSRASPSPAALLKLLVLEDEREMLARPFSFNLTKGLWERMPGPQSPTETPGPLRALGQTAEQARCRATLQPGCSRKLLESRAAQSQLGWWAARSRPQTAAAVCPCPLTSLCWGRFLESWGWRRFQTLSPEKNVRRPGS